MKVRNLYALLVTLVAAISLLLSCSDNDDPQPDSQPVLEPGEIPMADSIPSAYLGMNFIRQLTVTVGDCGGFFPNQPLISIYDNASDKEEATAKYDAELYFVRLADGKEYRPGEALPYSDERNPIGHHMDIYPAVKRDVPPLILGNIGNNVDDVLVMHWPQKVQSLSPRVLVWATPTVVRVPVPIRSQMPMPWIFSHTWMHRIHFTQRFSIRTTGLE